MSADLAASTSPEGDLGLEVNPTPDPIPVRAVFVRAHGLPSKLEEGAVVGVPVVAQELTEPRGEWVLRDVVPAWDEPGEHLLIRLFPDEAEGYYLNVTTDNPAIFVHWRTGDTPQALLVTLSYNEAGRLLDGGETVDSVPMPPEMNAWLTEYVNLNYQPEQKKKKGGRNRPSFMRREEFGKMVDVEKGLGPKPEGVLQGRTGKST
jgi:Protein of unknown function (DUF3305)